MNSEGVTGSMASAIDSLGLFLRFTRGAKKYSCQGPEKSLLASNGSRKRVRDATLPYATASGCLDGIRFADNPAGIAKRRALAKPKISLSLRKKLGCIAYTLGTVQYMRPADSLPRSMR